MFGVYEVQDDRRLSFEVEVEFEFEMEGLD